MLLNNYTTLPIFRKRIFGDVMKYFNHVIVLSILSLISLLIGVSNIDMNVLIYSRIPRLMSLILAGASLSMAGLIMQLLSKNKFTSPSTIGTVESATLGLCISLLYFGNHNLIINMIFGFIFSILGTILVFFIFNKIRFKDVVMLPLIGIMFGKVISALTTFIAYKYELMQDLDMWVMGDFSSIMKGNYEILYLSIPALIFTYCLSYIFTIIGFGDKFASNLGIEYNKIKNIGILIISLISSITIISVGHLPFIGLIVPNIVIMLYGANVSKNLPLICIDGAVITIICDIFSRLILYPYEVPISLILGILGSIYFIILILRRKHDG